jgi:hypothetical protein
MSTVELDINGLVLESKFAEYQFLAKGPMHQVWRDGFPVQEQKILRFEFDRYICLVDQMVREQEWTPEDCTYAMRHVATMLADQRYTDMWVHVKPKITPPWPTYDETHPKQIHTVAQAVGLVREALAYEQQREGGPRQMVVENLQKALGDDPVPPPEPQEASEEVADEMYA